MLRMGYHLAKDMPINRHRKTSNLINSTEYTPEKVYEQSLTTTKKRTIPLNPRTQNAEACISVSELNGNLCNQFQDSKK